MTRRTTLADADPSSPHVGPNAGRRFRSGTAAATLIGGGCPGLLACVSRGEPPFSGFPQTSLPCKRFICLLLSKLHHEFAMIHKNSSMILSLCLSLCRRWMPPFGRFNFDLVVRRHDRGKTACTETPASLEAASGYWCQVILNIVIASTTRIHSDCVTTQPRVWMLVTSETDTSSDNAAGRIFRSSVRFCVRRIPVVDVSSPTEANTPSGIDSAAGRISVTGVTIIPILAARHRQKTLHD